MIGLSTRRNCLPAPLGAFNKHGAQATHFIRVREPLCRNPSDMEPTQEQANEERIDETVGNEIVGNERPVDPDFDASRIAQMLQVRRTQVEKVARLLADGHEPAFIARHRRDLTLGLPEEAVWRIHDLIAKQKAQAGRRSEIIASLTAQGRLNGLLEEAINEAEHPRRLEDIQAPLRPRRRSISAPFRDKGLGNLAEAIWQTRCCRMEHRLNRWCRIWLILKEG